MKQLKNIAMYVCCLLGGAIAQTSCDIIDDDLSDCEKDYRVTLHVMTQVDDVLESRLYEADDQPIRQALRSPLHDIFSEQGYDTDIAFYADDAAADIKHHYRRDMAGSRQSTWHLFYANIPYRNVVVANVGREPMVDFADTLTCHSARLRSMTDTIGTQQQALFTGREDVFVPSRQDTTVNVDLYMANGCAVLVVDTTGVSNRDIRTYMTGTASAFLLSDSTYSYAQSPVVRTRRIDAQERHEVAFVGLTLPSPDQPTRADESARDGSYWQMVVFVDLPDGTTTRNVIYVRQPLKADHLLILKARLTPEGVVEAVDVNAGISFDLDWAPGGEWNPTF